MSNTIEIAERLKGLREIEEVSTAEMAAVCSMSEADYIKHESGTVDFSVTMLCKCAERLGIDVTALFTGHTPKLKGYSIVRAGEGLKVERRQSFTYQHLASNFCGSANRLWFPLLIPKRNKLSLSLCQRMKVRKWTTFWTEALKFQSTDTRTS